MTAEIVDGSGCWNMSAMLPPRSYEIMRLRVENARAAMAVK